MRILVAVALALLSCILGGCGSNSSIPSQNTGAMSGNWQFNLKQTYPIYATPLSAGGFLVQANNSLTGSVQGPVINQGVGLTVCGGVGPLVGTINGQNVTFSLNPGGTQFNFSGTISADSQSMSGSYQALGGACLGVPTTGTWTATLVPPMNGNFTGTLVSTQYMPLLTGLSAVPIAVSGSFTQSSNAGASNASLTGTITAVGYPCFRTVYLNGTINGQNVYLNVYDYSGVLIGTLGVPGANGVLGSEAPATVVSGPNGISLVGTAAGGATNGLMINSCPALADPQLPPPSTLSSDGDTVNFKFSF